MGCESNSRIAIIMRARAISRTMCGKGGCEFFKSRRLISQNMLEYTYNFVVVLFSVHRTIHKICNFRLTAVGRSGLNVKLGHDNSAMSGYFPKI